MKEEEEVMRGDGGQGGLGTRPCKYPTASELSKLIHVSKKMNE